MQISVCTVVECGRSSTLGSLLSRVERVFTREIYPFLVYKLDRVELRTRQLSDRARACIALERLYAGRVVSFVVLLASFHRPLMAVISNICCKRVTGRCIPLSHLQ